MPFEIEIVREYLMTVRNDPEKQVEATGRRCAWR